MKTAELALGALRAEHRQVIVNVEVGTPLLGSVLVVARLAAALDALRSRTASTFLTRYEIVRSSASRKGDPPWRF